MNRENENNRRELRAVPLDSEPLEIQIIGSDFIDIIFADNVSFGGMGITIPHRFEGCNIDSPVEIVIAIPGGGSHKAKGIIRHTNSTETKRGIFGLEIKEMDDEGMVAYHRYVDELLRPGD
jgi:hypothetical protein